MLPTDLIKLAMSASGAGLTSTLRRGLELVAAKDVYAKLLDLKGKFDLGIDLEAFRQDRKE